MSALPQGTVTFLFTDVEGSTRLLHELGEGYAEVLAEHRRLLREAFARHGGVEVDTQGDAFFVAFAKASAALAAASDARAALAEGPIRVRVGLHTGEPLVTDEGYVGIDVHRAARIAAAGHGGQVLVSQSTRDLVGADAFRDLGAHRLKDIADPERIYQLGDGDFPPLKTLNNSNLPSPGEPLVGRKRELADVLRLLRDSARLVTVTGPGGTGKTRFALEAAFELIESFRDGVWWIGLAPVRDPDLVLPTIAAAVGAKDELVADLRGKELLLLLDNFEHVVDAAVDVAEIQRACAGVSAIVTSREPLHIAGERELPLAPLAESPAVELFRQRAAAVAPDFDADYATLVELCDRLDRLPLAIELAAARTKTAPATELLDRLEQRLPLLTSRRRDVDERQRTLRATIEWSYELLDENEKRDFAALGVFAGSFDTAAADAVAGVDLDSLESLIDKSLVHRREDGRFFMLETIREYAASMVDGDLLRERHLDYYLRVVIEAEAFLAERSQQALAMLAVEENNIRAALAHACDTGDAERALMLAGSNWRFWSFRTQIGEAVRWYERAFALPGAASPRARARALYGLGEMEQHAGHSERARTLLEEAVPALRDADEDRWVASAMNHLAAAYLNTGDYARARALFEETLSLARDIGSDRLTEIVITNLGYLAVVEGRYDDAEALLDEAYELARRDPDGDRGAITLENLALLELLRGDPVSARERLRQCLEAFRSLPSDAGLLEAILLAGVVAGRDDQRRNARLQSAARSLAAGRGYELSTTELAVTDPALAEARAELGEEAFAEEWALGEQLGRDAALELALQSID
jgi:predicted ATPase/Tfp pilus assembly protein PilF